MAIQGRSARRLRWEKELEKDCPAKLKLYRAKAYNCNGPLCLGVDDGRQSVNANCDVCNGTGYIGGDRNADIVTAAFANDIRFFYGDIQFGHGIYGSGGNFVDILQDLGKGDSGDALCYCKVEEIDFTSGVAFYPTVSQAQTRPDAIVGFDNAVWYVIKDLVLNIGSDNIARVLTLANTSYSK